MMILISHKIEYEGKVKWVKYNLMLSDYFLLRVNVDQILLRVDRVGSLKNGNINYAK